MLACDQKACQVKLRKKYPESDNLKENFMSYFKASCLKVQNWHIFARDFRSAFERKGK